MSTTSILRRCRISVLSSLQKTNFAHHSRPLPRPYLPRPIFQSSCDYLQRKYATDSSTDKASTEATPTAGASDPAPAAAGTEDAMTKSLEAKDREIIDLKDKYMRSIADFRNLQERTRREILSAKEFAIQRFAKDLIESVDNFDRALAVVSEDSLSAAEKDEGAKELVNLYKGLKMTESMLMQTLKKHGLERFDPQGSPFNPNEHEATFMVPKEDFQDGSVFHTQSKGFKLNGRILRAAKVGVVKNT